MNVFTLVETIDSPKLNLETCATMAKPSSLARPRSTRFRINYANKRCTIHGR
jgi:hypothetical protein